MVRIVVILTFITTTIFALYKWRYKLLNMVLAVSFLKKIAVYASMNMPAIRNKFIPNLFGRSSNS